MSGNEELTKAIESLMENIKSIKDELQTLKHSAIQNGLNPQSLSSMQQSNASVLTSDDPPPGKKTRRTQRQTRN